MLYDIGPLILLFKLANAWISELAALATVDSSDNEICLAAVSVFDDRRILSYKESSKIPGKAFSGGTHHARRKRSFELRIP